MPVILFLTGASKTKVERGAPDNETNTLLPLEQVRLPPLACGTAVALSKIMG
ncbi:MAG: hypothetical protein ACREIC_15520 [Limisphaerales bacterium]